MGFALLRFFGDFKCHPVVVYLNVEVFLIDSRELSTEGEAIGLFPHLKAWVVSRCGGSLSIPEEVFEGKTGKSKRSGVDKVSMSEHNSLHSHKNGY